MSDDAVIRAALVEKGLTIEVYAHVGAHPMTDVEGVIYGEFGAKTTAISAAICQNTWMDG